MDAICHVVRCFDDALITHVANKVDPIDDLETIKTELYIADLEQIDRRLQRLERVVKQNDLDAKVEYDALSKIKEAILNDIDPKTVDLSDEALKLIKNFSLLSLKPAIYVGNVSDEDLKDPMSNPHYKALVEYGKKSKTTVIPISAQLEIAQLSITRNGMKNQVKQID